MYRFTFFIACWLFAAACNAGRTEKLEDKVFVVNIVPDEKKLQEYLEYHRHIWPEVEKGFQKAGYRKIKLLRRNHLVVMIVTVPEGADLGKMGKVAESYDKRCAEWNQLMSSYQQGIPGTEPGQTGTETAPF